MNKWREHKHVKTSKKDSAAATARWTSCSTCSCSCLGALQARWKQFKSEIASASNDDNHKQSLLTMQRSIGMTTNDNHCNHNHNANHNQSQSQWKHPPQHQRQATTTTTAKSAHLEAAWIKIFIFSSVKLNPTCGKVSYRAAANDLVSHLKTG